MASAEREPITGVWGQSPQRDPGAEPLVWGQGGEALLMLKGFSCWTSHRSGKFPSFYAFLNCKLQAVVSKKIVSYSYREKRTTALHRGMFLLFLGKGVVAVIV